MYNFDLVELLFNYLICRLAVSYGQPLVSKRQSKHVSTIQHWCLHHALELGHSVLEWETMNQLQIAVRHVKATNQEHHTNTPGCPTASL
jgi:hypothetical protein